jgi:hypothetical protein
MLGPLTDAVGTALQVPTDLVVNLALPIITTAAAGGWIAEAEPGWTEPLCLDTLSALPSGERKSPTLKVLDAPLRRFEQQSQQAARPERAQKLAERKLAEDQVEARRKDATKAIDDANSAKRKSYLAAVADLEKIEVDPLPRWLADDATPEAVVSLLAEYGSIGVISAEPGLFGILAGRYSSGAPNIEWFLKATSGEAIKVDRMGRDPQDVPNPAQSLACCIQPGRLVELGQVKAFRDSGLLARLLYVVPRSAVGERGRTTRVPEPLATAWDQQVTALAASGRKRRETPGVLPLDEAGRDALDEFRAEIEPQRKCSAGPPGACHRPRPVPRGGNGGRHPTRGTPEAPRSRVGRDRGQPHDPDRDAVRVRARPRAERAELGWRAALRAARTAPLPPRGGGPMTSADSARTALVLDELYTTPRGRQTITELNRHATTALVDQGRAAARDAHEWLEFEAPLLGAPVTELDIATLPEWLRLDLLTTWAAWSAGTGRTCMHSPHPDRPEPVSAAAWRPGLVACARCVHLTVLPPGSTADRTCDACGHVVAGLPDEGISPGRLTFGPMVYGYGVCPECRPDDLGHDPERGAS